MFTALKQANASLRGWRTILFHLVLGLPSLALVALDELKVVDITPLMPPDKALKIMAGINLAGIILRLVTKSAVGQPHDQ